MKYIRTKDGVYEIERYYEPRDYYWVKQDYDNQPIGSEEVLKQSDTIEELCDEFVFVDESGKKDLLNDDYKAMLQECGTFSVVHQLLKQDRPKELYGAIWTDKGLIYVAKMNERLEMELI